jgi:hypothetical protein
MSPDPVDRRQDEREFKDDIRTQLAVILTTQRVHHDALDKMERQLAERFERLHDRLETLEDVYRGGMGSAGVEERLREVERLAQKHDLMLTGPPDGGMAKRLERVEGAREDRREYRRQTLTFRAAIIAAVLSTVGLIVSNWPRIAKTFEEDGAKSAYERLKASHQEPTPVPKGLKRRN